MSLKSCCSRFEAALKKGEQSDIDGNELYVELKLLQEFLPKDKIGPVDILKFLIRVDCFPNTIIAYNFVDSSCDSCICREKFF